MATVSTLTQLRQGLMDWLLSPQLASQMETLEIVLDADQMEMILASMAQVHRADPGDLVSVAEAFEDLGS